jgi:hypothetical protein
VKVNVAMPQVLCCDSRRLRACAEQAKRVEAVVRGAKLDSFFAGAIPAILYE